MAKKADIIDPVICPQKWALNFPGEENNLMYKWYGVIHMEYKRINNIVYILKIEIGPTILKLDHYPLDNICYSHDPIYQKIIEANYFTQYKLHLLKYRPPINYEKVRAFLNSTDQREFVVKLYDGQEKTIKFLTYGRLTISTYEGRSNYPELLLEYDSPGYNNYIREKFDIWYDTFIEKS
jgi:hypothetical protein